MYQNTNESKLKNIGIQFFADPPAPSEPPAGNPAPPAPADPPADPLAGKSYTQEQLNTMMANEKRTARQALLKELGFDIKDDKSYKDTIKNIKATLDAGKTQAQLDAEAKAAAETAKAEAEAKANKLEMKVAALSAGVKPDCLSDAIALAQSKVSDTVTVEQALADLKTKYPVFFNGTDEESSGTGNSTNPPRRTGGKPSDGLGKRLAQSGKNTTKSTYFKN